MTFSSVLRTSLVFVLALQCQLPGANHELMTPGAAATGSRLESLSFKESFACGLAIYQSDLAQSMKLFRQARSKAVGSDERQLAEFGIQLVEDSRNGSYRFFSWDALDAKLKPAGDVDLAILHSTLCLYISKAVPVSIKELDGFRDQQMERHLELAGLGGSDLVVATACQAAVYRRAYFAKWAMPTGLMKRYRESIERLRLRQDANDLFQRKIIRQLESMVALETLLEYGDSNSDWSVTAEAESLLNQALQNRDYALLEVLLQNRCHYFSARFANNPNANIRVNKELCALMDQWGHQVYRIQAMNQLARLYRRLNDRAQAQLLMLEVWKSAAFENLAYCFKNHLIESVQWVRDDADHPEFIERFDSMFDREECAESRFLTALSTDLLKPMFRAFIARQETRLETHQKISLKQQLTAAKQEADKKTKKLNAEIERLMQSVASKGDEVARLDQELKQLEGKLETTGRRLAGAQTQLDRKESDLLLVEGRLQTARKEISQVEAVASRAFATALMAGLASVLLIGFIVVNHRRSLFAKRLHQERERSAALKIKLARHQRMDSLGLMAGSVAHDFNNILTGVSGNAELVEIADQRGNFDRDFVLKRIKMIREAAERARRLANQMLNYSGKQFAARRTMDLNQVVLAYRSVIESAGSQQHQFNIDLADRPLLAKIDDTQVEQVILNLITNAVDASPRGGEITVRTGCAELGSEVETDPTYFGGSRAAGKFAYIEVQDQGIGISKDQLDKIFEPYYSSSGAGRGLGLAVVHGVMESHEGLIHCDPEQQQGAKLRLLFPIAAVDDLDSIDEFLQDGFEASGSLAGKSILVVDDDPSVLEASRNLLEMIGMKTTAVPDGTECLEVLADEQIDFDCILMDVMMPEMPASEILDQFVEREIHHPVILMSGFSAQRLDFFLKRPNVKAILPKPFSVDELKRALNASIFGERKTDVSTEATAESHPLKGPNFKNSADRDGNASSQPYDDNASD
jgi:signal transduction histidine kinase/CheY-like chemotaxis protein